MHLRAERTPTESAAQAIKSCILDTRECTTEKDVLEATFMSFLQLFYLNPPRHHIYLPPPITPPLAVSQAEYPSTTPGRDGMARPNFVLHIPGFLDAPPITHNPAPFLKPLPVISATRKILDA